LSWCDPVQNLVELRPNFVKSVPIEIWPSWSWTKFRSIRPNLSNSLVSALWTKIWIHIHYLDPKWLWIRFSIELTP